MCELRVTPPISVTATVFKLNFEWPMRSEAVDFVDVGYEWKQSGILPEDSQLGDFLWHAGPTVYSLSSVLEAKTLERFATTRRFLDLLLFVSGHCLETGSIRVPYHCVPLCTMSWFPITRVYPVSDRPNMGPFAAIHMSSPADPVGTWLKSGGGRGIHG